MVFVEDYGLIMKPRGMVLEFGPQLWARQPVSLFLWPNCFFAFHLTPARLF
jgi:hypothetical protein